MSTDGIGTTTANVAPNIVPVADITPDTVATNEDTNISFDVLTGTNGATADSFEGSPTVSGGRDPLIGERSAADEVLKLRVEAVYSDGSVVVQEVKIDTATGAIQPLNAGNQGAAVPLFREQFRARAMLTPDETGELARALAG